MRGTPFLKAMAFVVVAIVMSIATGPLIAMLGALTGVSENSVWLYAALFSAGLALPLGLHLGGNWVQASVFSFLPVGISERRALWTVYVTDVQQRLLFAPDFEVHAPYIATMLVMMFMVWRLFPSRASVA